MTYRHKLLCIPESWYGVMPGYLLWGWVGALWDHSSAPLPLSALHHRLHPGEPTQSCLPLSPHSWLKTLLHGLRHKSPKWIKLLSLSSFLRWEISENKSLCRLVFFHVVQHNWGILLWTKEMWSWREIAGLAVGPCPPPSPLFSHQVQRAEVFQLYTWCGSGVFPPAPWPACTEGPELPWPQVCIPWYCHLN